MRTELHRSVRFCPWIGEGYSILRDARTPRNQRILNLDGYQVFFLGGGYLSLGLLVQDQEGLLSFLYSGSPTALDHLSHLKTIVKSTVCAFLGGWGGIEQVGRHFRWCKLLKILLCNL